MAELLSEKAHFVKGKDPIADAFTGTVYSDVICIKNWRKITFVIMTGAVASGGVGTTTITVVATEAASPLSYTAIPFKYRAITSGDTVGALTSATAAAGFTTTAGASQLYLIEVNCEELAGLGMNWIAMKGVEVADSPIIAGILGILTEPRYAVDTDTVIA